MLILLELLLAKATNSGTVPAGTDGLTVMTLGSGTGGSGPKIGARSLPIRNRFPAGIGGADTVDIGSQLIGVRFFHDSLSVAAVPRWQPEKSNAVPPLSTMSAAAHAAHFLSKESHVGQSHWTAAMPHACVRRADSRRLHTIMARLAMRAAETNEVIDNPQM
jgi:hypothetical protein